MAQEEKSSLRSWSSPGDPLLSSRIFGILSGVLGVVSFLSTALAEITGALLLSIAALRLIVNVRSGIPLRVRDSSLLIPLFLWGVYLAAVSCSLEGGTAPLISRAGLLWHPLIFPAALLLPRDRRGLRTAGILFVLGGAASGAAALTLDVLRTGSGAPFALTGLTTFTDLLALAGVTALSFFVPSGRVKAPAWAFLLPAASIAAALVWSAERAPVVAFAGAGTVLAARGGPRPLAAWACVLLACLLAGPPAISYKMEWLIRGGPVDRYVVWEEGIKTAPGAPLFGFGPGSYAGVLPAGAWARFVNRPPSSWHNDILETWLDSGPIATGAFIGLLLAGIARALRGGTSRGNGGKESYGLPGLLFLCLAAFGLVGSVVTTSVLGLAFWLLLGLTLNPGNGPPSS